MTHPAATALPKRPAPVRPVSRVGAPPADALFQLNLRALFAAFFASSPAFWCASFYLFIEYVRPQQIYTSIAFIPWGKIALGSAFVLGVLEGRVKFKEQVPWALVALFTAVIVVSSGAAIYPQVSFDDWNVWIIWLLAMMVVAGASRTRAELLMTFVLWCLWNFKMSQSAFRSWAGAGFAFRDWGVAGAPGWFSNSGEFGIEMCVFLPVIGYLLVGLWPRLTNAKRAILAVVALSAIISAVGSSSRGAVLGMAAIGLWILLRSKQRVKAMIVVALLSAVVWTVMPAENKQRWSEAGDDDTSVTRIEYWKDGIRIANAHPVFGIGYRNWLPYYRANYNPKGQLPHNIFIECVAELGYVGLAVFIALIVETFRQNYKTRKQTSQFARAPDRFLYFMAFGLDGALIGYMASGFFVTVLFYPYFWINFGFTIALARYAGSRLTAASPRRGTGRPLPSRHGA